MTKKSVIGVSLGGKMLLVGKVVGQNVEKSVIKRINNSDSESEIIKEIISTIKEVMDDTVIGIGFGAPSLVDVKQGIVYSVRQIKSWREVHIKEILEDTLNVPVYVNNDANCFAIGEHYFGKGKGVNNLIGLILGAGVGAGIVFKSHLYSGSNCGAGEYGNLPYKKHDLEHYLSESYFDNKYGFSFDSLYKRAKNDDKIALAIMEQYGNDLGNAIKMIMYTVDPELIIIGGPIAVAFEYFKISMWETVLEFVYPHSLQKLKIEVSEQKDIAILGAAALYFDANNKIMVK
jgi:glucokinase